MSFHLIQASLLTGLFHSHHSQGCMVPGMWTCVCVCVLPDMHCCSCRIRARNVDGTKHSNWLHFLLVMPWRRRVRLSVHSVSLMLRAGSVGADTSGHSRMVSSNREFPLENAAHFHFLSACHCQRSWCSNPTQNRMLAFRVDCSLKWDFFFFPVVTLSPFVSVENWVAWVGTGRVETSF